jgi:hypothetical protein
VGVRAGVAGDIPAARRGHGRTGASSMAQAVQVQLPLPHLLETGKKTASPCTVQRRQPFASPICLSFVGVSLRLVCC